MPLVAQIIQLLLAGIEIMPQIAQAAQLEYNLFMSGTPPTPAQDAQIQAALDAANAALQAA
jgi:hypothetical protein